MRGVSNRTLAPWAEPSSSKGPRLPIGPERRGEGGWEQQDTQLVGVNEHSMGGCHVTSQWGAVPGFGHHLGGFLGFFLVIARYQSPPRLCVCGGMRGCGVASAARGLFVALTVGNASPRKIPSGLPLQFTRLSHFSQRE